MTPGSRARRGCWRRARCSLDQRGYTVEDLSLAASKASRGQAAARRGSPHLRQSRVLCAQDGWVAQALRAFVGIRVPVRPLRLERHVKA
jgi:hypothetical protein